MAIRGELIDELPGNHKTAEDLFGQGGLLRRSTWSEASATTPA